MTFELNAPVIRRGRVAGPDDPVVVPEEKPLIQAGQNDVPTLGSHSELTTMFEFLNVTKTQYVVLDNWHALPLAHDPKMPCTILVQSAENFKTITKGMWEAAPLGDQPTMLRILDPKGGTIFRCRCIEKGRGFLPERFESQLLQMRHLREGVAVPDSHCKLSMSIYRYLYYGHDMTNVETRQAMKMFADDAVGIGPLSDENNIRFSFENYKSNV